MNTKIKQQILDAANTVVEMSDYKSGDQIFSQEYGITSVDMAYILMDLSKRFNFTINDEFIDALEMCTFNKLEALLVKYENTAVTDATPVITVNDPAVPRAKAS